MELGHYGWNKNVNFYQPHAVFINKTVPASTTYGILNLGSAPFDGISSGTFVGNTNGTVLAINTPLGYSGNFIDIQVAGVINFKIGSGFTQSSGIFQVDDSIGTPTKSYRFRTTGSSLDWEISGTSLFISGWTGANFTGSQSYFFQLDPNNANMNFKKSFFPDTALLTMGLSTDYWLSSYSKNLFLNSTAHFDGTTAGLANLTGSLTASGDLIVQGKSGFDFFRVDNSVTGSPSVVFNNEIVSTSFVYFQIADDGGGLGASSGTQDYVRITPNIQQSGTASYTALKINVSEGSLGATLNYLADFQLGNVSQASIDTTGKILSRGISMPDDLLAIAWMEVAG